jgi:hypothetical protein
MSMVSVEDTQGANLGLLQLLQGQYGVKRYRVAEGHLCPKVFHTFIDQKANYRMLFFCVCVYVCSGAAIFKPAL